MIEEFNLKINFEELYSRLLVQAELALEEGTFPVSALLLSPDGEVTGLSRNTVYPDYQFTEHAEFNLIQRTLRLKATSEGLKGYTLITTLEPCLMCTGAIWASKLSGLIWLLNDEKCGAFSRLDLSDYPHVSKLKILAEPSQHYRLLMKNLWDVFMDLKRSSDFENCC